MVTAVHVVQHWLTALPIEMNHLRTAAARFADKGGPSEGDEGEVAGMLWAIRMLMHETTLRIAAYLDA